MSNQSAFVKYFDAEAISKITAIGYKPLSLVEGNLVGNHRSPSHGFAVEFAGHRQYSPGDDIKHLDWNAYFKSDKYLIKQYAMETNFVGNILIDVSATMGFEYEGRRKMDYAAFIAVTLASCITRQNDLVATTFFADKVIETIPQTGAQEIIAKISSTMENTEPKHPSSFGKFLNHIGEQIGFRQSVFVISDFFADPEEIFAGLKRLLYNHNEVILFQIIDPIEMDFNVKGRVELHGLEEDEKLEFEGQNIRKSYNKIFNKYRSYMESESLKLGIDYVLCDTSEKPGGEPLLND